MDTRPTGGKTDNTNRLHMKIIKNQKGIKPTSKVVELIAAAIVCLIIVSVVTTLISQAGSATEGCGAMNQWIADSFNIDTC